MVLEKLVLIAFWDRTHSAPVEAASTRASSLEILESVGVHDDTDFVLDHGVFGAVKQ